jgi:rSAM/selenodomain-associated transferase 1
LKPSQKARLEPRLEPVLIVIAKAPVPGMSKTRLCPPCTPTQAAAVAEAALADTLSAVMAVAGVRHVLALEGAVGPWLPRGIDVIPQRGDGLDQRIAGAFDDCGAPALLIGMDTPQVTPALLRRCVDALLAPGVDAVIGPATDGGWWAAGLRRPQRSAFLGVPMSTSQTCAAQRRRLAGLGLNVAELPALSDVDVWEDALSVSGAAAGGRFAAAVAAVAVAWVAL